MEKLTFYVLSSPEKLDRVGEYLYHKLSRDIYRRRNGLVENVKVLMPIAIYVSFKQT
jgi:hypothetical protein